MLSVFLLAHTPTHWQLSICLRHLMCHLSFIFATKMISLLHINVSQLVTIRRSMVTILDRLTYASIAAQHGCPAHYVVRLVAVKQIISIGPSNTPQNKLESSLKHRLKCATQIYVVSASKLNSRIWSGPAIHILCFAIHYGAQTQHYGSANSAVIWCAAKRLLAQAVVANGKLFKN